MNHLREMCRSEDAPNATIAAQATPDERISLDVCRAGYGDGATAEMNHLREICRLRRNRGEMNHLREICRSEDAPNAGIAAQVAPDERISLDVCRARLRKCGATAGR
jgi:hypothetical protein